MKHLNLLLLSFVFIASCKKDIASNNQQSVIAQHADAASVAIVEHNVKPQGTDPAITTATIGSVMQYAYVPSDLASYKNKLFVFLPGTFSTPVKYLEVVRSAARHGFHAFGIAYDNLSTIEAQSGETNDDTRTEKIFEEYLTGNDVSSVVNVPKANGLENRIIKMIQYMDAKYTSENWKQFLTAQNNIRWDMLSVAGHSQGADHTMYMSKKRNLYRAGFFSGPYNFKLKNGNYPSFINNTGITPVGHVFGFIHTKDPVRVWSDVKLNWRELNMPGAATSVDNTTSFSGTNRLITSAKARLSVFHGMTVADDATPLDENGIPLYDSVWAYMCFP